MSMHKVTITPTIRATLAELNCWEIRIGDVEKLANLLIGNLQIPVLRRGNQTAIVGGVKSGGSPNRFGEEFRQLARECATIFDGTELSAICGAAFFHRRFEAIHPLVDSNGRLGRLLMAEQLRRSFPIEIETIQDKLIEREEEYRAIRVRLAAQEQFERLVRLLARVVDREIEAVPPCPYPLPPRFPESQAALEEVVKKRPTNPVSVEPLAFKKRASVAVLGESVAGAEIHQNLLGTTRRGK